MRSIAMTLTVLGALAGVIWTSGCGAPDARPRRSEVAGQEAAPPTEATNPPPAAPSVMERVPADGLNPKWGVLKSDAKASVEEVEVARQVIDHALVFAPGSAIDLTDPAFTAGEPRISWGEDELGSTIVSARYQRKWKGLEYDTASGEGAWKEAAFDVHARKWFIPIKELLDGRESDAHAGLLQRVFLELHQKDGTLAELEMRFSVQGPLPEIGAAVARIGEAQLSGCEKLQDSYSFQKIEIENPSARKVSVWIRAGGRIDAHADVEHTYYRHNIAGPPPSPDLADVYGSGILQLQVEKSARVATAVAGRLSARENAGDARIVGYQAGWTKVTLGSMSSMVLESSAAADFKALCRVPADRKVNYHLCIPSSGAAFGCPEDFNQLQVASEIYRVVSFTPQITADVEMRIADPKTPFEQVTAAPGAKARVLNFQMR